MKKMFIACAIVLMLMVMGCAKEAPEATTPEAGADAGADVTAPAADTAPDTEGEAVATAGNDVLSAISCDTEAKTVTFTVTNTNSKDWHFEKVSVMEATEKVPARISINGKQLSDANVLCGIDVLAAGQSVTCTKTYDDATFASSIRLGSENLGTLDYNTLRLQSLDVNTVIEFNC
jgi:hypothetical protein